MQTTVDTCSQRRANSVTHSTTTPTSMTPQQQGGQRCSKHEVALFKVSAPDCNRRCLVSTTVLHCASTQEVCIRLYLTQQLPFRQLSCFCSTAKCWSWPHSMGQHLNFGCMLAAKPPREHRSSYHHGLQGHSDHILECFHSIHPQCGHPRPQGAQLSLAMQPYYSSDCQVLSSRIAAVLPALQPTTHMLSI